MDTCVHELDSSIGGHGQAGSSRGDRDNDGEGDGDADGAGNDTVGGRAEDDDRDYLEELLRNIGGVKLIQSTRGVENLERVKRASKANLYGIENGCRTHWTTLHFVLELLTLKAKYHCSDCSFNDLLRLMGWLLPNPNSVTTNTYDAKKLISPLTMGVEKYNMPKPLYPLPC